MLWYCYCCQFSTFTKLPTSPKHSPQDPVTKNQSGQYIQTKYTQAAGLTVCARGVRAGAGEGGGGDGRKGGGTIILVHNYEE